MSQPLQAQTLETAINSTIDESIVQTVKVEAPVVDPIQVDITRVLISEVAIEGITGHPEEDRLRLSVYDAMQIRPGRQVTRNELQNDLNAIQATGWFSNVRIILEDKPLGVRVVVQVNPFPVLTRVELNPAYDDLTGLMVEKIFASNYGRTLNLNDLYKGIKILQDWFAGEGYSLARITGPEQITPDGIASLRLTQGRILDIKVRFLTKNGDDIDENGNLINGKTKEWVINREISARPGQPFNRNILEDDIKRLYRTQLFSDVKVTLKPVPEQPGDVVLILGIVEQSTGQISGGLGYSQNQGIFGQAQFQDTNLFGRAWDVGLNVTYGQYGGLSNLTFTDPWIAGDRHRTGFRGSLFLSQQVPQVFQSEDNGNIRTLKGYANGRSHNIYKRNPKYDFRDFKKFPDIINETKYEHSNVSWFNYEGDSVALRKTGGNFALTRPLNGGNPFKDVPWRVLIGMSFEDVRPINFSANSRSYGVSTNKLKSGVVESKDVICISYGCAKSNILTGFRLAATYNTYDDSNNPTNGSFFTASTQQFVGVNENSPTFNKLLTNYTRFFPVNWLKLHKGCRPKLGETASCPQAVGLQVKAGVAFGDIPPYEAFCLGGSNSIRGWYDCDLAVAKAFSEITLEYRFPLISIFSGEVFMDAGTDFDTQKDIQGRPGLLLNKDGTGVSVGTGVIVRTPVGPLRLEVATKDFNDDYRFNLGVGWKF
ncbi:BamA/TamA family outer membrane protein [Synechococcus sp. M16CYN]